MTNLGGLKLAKGGGTGGELDKAEGGGAGGVMVAELEWRICMARLWAVRRSEPLKVTKSGFEAMARVYCFTADSSSKMSLSWMASWNISVRRTIRWSGGG